MVAWRIYYLNKLGREVPQSPCTVYFGEADWKALMVFTTSNLFLPPSRRPCVKPSTVLPVSAGFSDAKVTASQERKSCGSVCSVWMTSLPCGA